MNNPAQKKIIGCEEWCTFSELGIPAIKARVDSGAKTSAIHAVNTQKFHRNHQLWVRFEVHPLQSNHHNVICCERPVIDERVVKSSSGDTDTRFVIQAPLKLGDETWDIELTLANREVMTFRMLLGREAMKGRLIIDPELTMTQGDISSEKLAFLYRTQ